MVDSVRISNRMRPGVRDESGHSDTALKSWWVKVTKNMDLDGKPLNDTVDTHVLSNAFHSG